MMTTERTAMPVREDRPAREGECEACSLAYGTLTITEETVLCAAHQRRLDEARQAVTNG